VSRRLKANKRAYQARQSVLLSAVATRATRCQEDRSSAMTAAAVTTAPRRPVVLKLPLFRRTRATRRPEAFGAPASYIPHSTADLWRSARPRLGR
jgi:hypothetical protein